VSSSSPALKWFVLLLLLPVTLGWKLAVRPGDTRELMEKQAQLKVAEFLVRQRFTVAVADKIEEGRLAIRATFGTCRMLISKSPAMGWDRDMLRHQTTPGDRVFVVFRGKVYAEQPTWLTVSDSLWSRFRRELGLKTDASPVLAVIATSNCDAERLPWHELGWYAGSPQPNDVA
jgi:predicted small integral membrane protein